MPASLAGEGRHVPAGLLRLARAVTMARGRQAEVERLVRTSPVPSILLDGERRYVQANVAARLLLRRPIEQMRDRVADDATPPQRLPGLQQLWAELLRRGCVAGTFELTLPAPEQQRVRVVYCGVANALPGQHWFGFVPADWTDDDLGVDERPATPSRPALSPRELQVLELAATGMRLEEIADYLTVAPATVKTHLRNVHRKLGARNRAHAIALAIAHGLLDPR